jgi:hypothetical protein
MKEKKTIIYKKLHRKLKIKQPNPTKTGCELGCSGRVGNSRVLITPLVSSISSYEGNGHAYDNFRQCKLNVGIILFHRRYLNKDLYVLSVDIQLSIIEAKICKVP